MAGPWEEYGAVEAPPWEQYQRPALLNPNLAAQGVKAEGAQEAMRAGADFLSGRDPGVDYKSGIKNALFRAGFSRMTNDAEKENYLNRSVGTGKWGKDSRGAYFIKPEGLSVFGMKSDKPISIDEQDTTRYDIADYAGDAPAIIGGAGFGIAATGVGLVPGLAMAGLGAAGGKAVDEIVKNMQGLQIKSAGDVAKTLAGEGAMGVVGEGVGRALMPVARFAAGPGASRMTPEKKALADSALEQGFKVRPGSVTDAPILARWEGMVRNIFGDLHAEQNKKAAAAGAERLRGVAEPVSKAEAGNAISASVKALRVKFAEDMAKQYKVVDDLVGNTPIIPTASIKKAAEELLEAMPKTDKGKVVSGIDDSLIKDIMGMGDATTVAQAQRLRTMLREASEASNLVPGVAKHEARVLKKTVEEAFEQAKNSPDPQMAKAVQALREADAAYKVGIRRFDNPVVTAITKDASKGGIDADMVVDYLIRPERIVRLRHVRGLVPEEQWAKVKASHAQDLISNVVKGTDDPLVNIFNGRAFRDTLDKYGREVLEEVHGKEWVDSAYKYATALMLAEKKMSLSGGIVAANIALHPIQNLPKLVWVRALAHLMEQPGTFKYLTEGFRLGPNTKEGAAAITRLLTQAAANARDETGSARITVGSPE